MEPAPRPSESWVLIVVVVLLLVVAVPGVLFMGLGTGMMGGGAYTGGWWFLGLVGLLVAVVGVLAALLLAPHRPANPPYLIPAPGYPPPAPAVSMTPIQILEARYARGEITRDEYLRMRQDLEPRHA